MAVSKIKINTNSLNQTRKELQAKLDKIKKDIEQISSDMNTLNSMWMGDAHQAFQQSVEEDMQILSEACDSIQGIINYESNAVTEYNKCEQQIADMITLIRI
jgi:WXG100 family type VII secretion target